MVGHSPVVSKSPTFVVEIGALIGDYRVTSLCSDGPSAQVFRAEHSRFLRKSAIKVLSQPIANPAERETLKELLGRASQVRHGNVVELYDFGFLEDRYLYLVMEWVDGLALDDKDSESLSLPLGDRFSMLQSIANAIDEVHLSDLTLGRLEDSQIIVDSKSGQPKLIAYAPLQGVSGDSDADSEATDAKNEGAGKAADYRRLGKLVEHMLLGGPDAVEDEAAEKIEVIVVRCLTTEASDQYTSAQAISRAIKGALGLEAPRSGTLEIGTLVGDSYKITGVIGKGGMGQVYEAVHVRLPQRVAIKVIDGTFTEEANIRFRQEAEIAASLGHPHLVRVIDFNTFEDGRPYMVMELLDGEDLGKSMRYGPLSPKRAIEIARQVGSALTAVHKKGIVHRDLKPPNVFLGKVAVGGELREHATVLDFGVSKREDATISVTKTSAVVGTPQYMAPEQALGENDTLTAKADQFSLGSLLYEMLSGAPAFGRGTLAEVVYRVCQENPPPLKLLLPDLPASVSNAVERAMSKRPADRFDSVANFVAEVSKDPVSDEALLPPISAETLRGVASPGDSSSAATVANKSSDITAHLATTARAKSADIARSDTVEAAGAAESSTSDGASGPLASSAMAKDVSAASPGFGIILAALGAAGALVLAYLLLSGGEGSKAPETPPTSIASETVIPSVVASDAGQGTVGENVDLAIADASSTVAANAADSNGDSGADDASVQAGVQVDAGGVDAKPKAVVTQGPTKPRKETGLPKEILDKLDAATRLLKEGSYRKARQLVSRDKRTAATKRGRAIAVKSYCGENNFGAAQDWLRRLPRSERRAVISYCKNVHQIQLN